MIYFPKRKMEKTNQSIMMKADVRAKLARFADQLNVTKADLIEFLICELEILTVGKFEEQKRLLELDSHLMEKYFGKFSVDSDTLNWQSILATIKREI